MGISRPTSTNRTNTISHLQGYPSSLPGQQSPLMPSTPSRSGLSSASSGSRRSPPPSKVPSRLRLTQLEDVNYPVRYPIHAVAPELADEARQQQAIVAGQINSRKYATSVDERNFITVFEYRVNEQTIIWDYFTGYVHLTGIWKAIGNSKADIVKLLDSTPQLEPVLRRVRGGFLKIQGTWLPYDVARQLSLRVAYHIRYALVPMFGADFPQQCLKPNDAGFGQLTLESNLHRMNGGLMANGHLLAHPHASGVPGPMGHVMPPNPSHLHALPQLLAMPIAPRQMPTTVVPHMGNMHFSPPPSMPGMATPNDTPPSRRVSESDLLRRRRFSSSLALAMPQPQAHRRSRTSSAPNRRGSVSMLARHRISEWAIGESSSDEDDEVRSPPAMPNKLSLPDDGHLLEQPDELVAMLQATRSLQQLSMGCSWGAPAGGDFEMSGRHYSWDGESKLEVVNTPNNNGEQIVVPSTVSSLLKDAAVTGKDLPSQGQRLPSFKSLFNDSWGV